jgi:hypothetical protein
MGFPISELVQGEDTMTKATEYLNENEKYIADKSQVALIEPLNDEQFGALIEAGNDAGHGDDFGNMTKTHETLADFESSRSAHWLQRGAV